MCFFPSDYACLRYRIARLEAENTALRAVVEAARPIVKWTADNCGDGVCDELDIWDRDIAALDQLQGTPAEPTEGSKSDDT